VRVLISRFTSGVRCFKSTQIGREFSHLPSRQPEFEITLHAIELRALAGELPPGQLDPAEEQESEDHDRRFPLERDGRDFHGPQPSKDRTSASKSPRALAWYSVRHAVDAAGRTTTSAAGGQVAVFTKRSVQSDRPT
jgi:hypothetical protein